MEGDADKFISKYDAIHNRIRNLAWADVLSTPVHGFRMEKLRNELIYNVRRVYKVLNFTSSNLTYKLQTNDFSVLEFAVTNYCGLFVNSLTFIDSLHLNGEYELYEDTNMTSNSTKL